MTSNVTDAAVVCGFILLSEARSMKSHVGKKRGLCWIFVRCWLFTPMLC